jgi:hypothetical protein
MMSHAPLEQQAPTQSSWCSEWAVHVGKLFNM